MSLTLAGQPAARGITISRAVLAESGTVEVVREFIAPEQVGAEIAHLLIEIGRASCRERV